MSVTWSPGPGATTGNDSFTGTDGADTNINGGSGDDTLSGLGGDDVLIGGFGSDLLLGGDGDDVLREGNDTPGGADTFDGGAGFDRVDYTAVTTAIVATPTGATGAGGVLDTFISIEGVSGGSGADSIDYSSFAERASLAGGAGDDTLVGGGHNDTLIGSTGNDSLVGGAGNDRIEGGTVGLAGGNNTVIGGAGNDTIIGGNGDDVLRWSLGDGGDIVQFGTGANTLDLEGWTPGTAVVDGATSGAWTVTFGKGGFDITFTNSGGGFVQVLDWSTSGATTTVTCFYPGTRIATPEGPRVVETLAIGDLVLTAGGAALPVRWMGRQTVSTRFGDPLRVLPIRLRAGALGAGLPERDLLVSPGHALLLDGILVEAGALVNGRTVTRERDVPEVFTYHHVELATHELILAEGVPAESFVDNAERLTFDNWAEHEALHGHLPGIAEMDLPRAASPRQVPATIRARLAAIAAEARPETAAA